MSPHILVVAFAIVFLVLATIGVPSHPRFSYGWAGMLLWLLSITVV